MPSLKVQIVDPPTEFAPHGKIWHQVQLKRGYLDPVAPNEYQLQFDLVDGVPKGDIVHYHGDKRRFIYIQWYGARGEKFRRIKLFFEHFLRDGVDSYEVRIAGSMKDGSPACSTARVLPVE